jgi:hypothetical protein
MAVAKYKNPKEYLSTLEPEKQVIMGKLNGIIKKNIPKGFEETMQYNMLSYVVPHSIYPAGYHCDAAQALPFVSLAATKGGYSLYHMGLYSSKELMDWFTAAYAKAGVGKLDMGKSCVRFKKAENIPFDLIGQLIKKMTVKDWIKIYENILSKGAKK